MAPRDGMLRVLGLWLIYAVVGILIVAGGDGGGSDEKRSPTRFRTKLVCTASGFSLLIAGVGFYVMQDPTAGAPETARLMTIGGSLLGLVVTFVAWSMIRRDLRRES